MLEKAVNLVLGSRRLLILTGAGISADSDIPTFRGKGGYWTYGSINYASQEVAMNSTF